MTGQTGAGGQTGHTTGLTGQYPMPSAPHTSIPSSAAPSRTNEMVLYTGPHGASQQGSGPHRGPIPNTNMACTGPSTQRVAPSLHASPDSRKIWPVCLNLNLGLIWVGHVYIKSHILPNLILFHILLVGAFPSLLNLMVTILVQLGSMLANMSCNWEKRS